MAPVFGSAAATCGRTSRSASCAPRRGCSSAVFVPAPPAARSEPPRSARVRAADRRREAPPADPQFHRVGLRQVEGRAEDGVVVPPAVAEGPGRHRVAVAAAQVDPAQGAGAGPPSRTCGSRSRRRWGSRVAPILSRRERVEGDVLRGWDSPAGEDEDHEDAPRPPRRRRQARPGAARRRASALRSRRIVAATRPPSEAGQRGAGVEALRVGERQQPRDARPVLELRAALGAALEVGLEPGALPGRECPSA